jgi:hypothetical protein
MTAVIVLLALSALSALIGFALGMFFLGLQLRRPASGSRYFPRRCCRLQASAPYQELRSSWLV